MTGGLAVAATVAVVASGRRGLVVAGWAVGVTGLIFAAAVSRVAISQAGPDAPVQAWPGPALAIAGAGLLLAIVAAGDRVPGLLRAGRWRSPAGLAVLGLGAVACSAPALAAAYWVSSGVTGPVRPATGTLLPEFVSVSSDTGQRLRTLVLQTAPHGAVTYLVLRDTDPLIGSPELALPAASGKALSQCVATLTAASGSAVADQGRALAGFGIGYVLLPAPVNAGLARLLDNVPGLRPVSVTPDFQLWRVVDTTARVTVTETGGTVVPVSSGPVSVTGARVPAAGGTLMLAEPAGGWTATLNGQPLTPLAAPVNGWAQGFRLPPGGGSLSVSHSNAGRAAVVALEGLAVLVVAGLGLPGARAAAEAELEQPAREGDELAGQEAGQGRRRASHGREPEERSRRRRLPRRGQEEPELPLGTEVPRPAAPARALSRHAAAVPAGSRAGWPRRGGPSDADEPYLGDETGPGERSYPGGEPFPGGPAYPGSPVPEQPAPVGRGRRSAADLSEETIAYRAPNGDVPGRHSHRAGPGQPPGRGPATDPGTPRQDGPATGPGRDAAGPGGGAGPGYDTGLPSRRGQDAPRGRGIGPRRARRDNSPAGYPGGRRGVGGQAAPEAGPGDGTGAEPRADRDTRERFSLPKRRGASSERAGRFGRGGRGAPPGALGSQGEPSQPGTRGGPGDTGGFDTGGFDTGGFDTGSHDGGSHPSGPLPGGSYQGAGSTGGGAHSSGPYPSGSYQGGQSPGSGPGGEGHPSGPYPSGPYQGGRSGEGGGAHASGPYPRGSYQGGDPGGEGHPSEPYPGGSYQGGRSGEGGGAHASGPYPSGSYPRGNPGGEGHPSGPYPSGSYRGGRPADGGPVGEGHPSGPYPSGSYQGGRPAGGGPDSGGYPSGPYSSDPLQGGRPQGGYDSGGHDSGGHDSGGSAGGGRGPGSGTGAGQASGRGGGRRGRSPGHARASRPGASGPAASGPAGSGLPGPGTTGPAQPPGPGPDDDDGALSPLPPLPPRASRHGEWDDPGRDRAPGDDQGEADW